MKYSIVISNIVNDAYAVVCKCWKIDEQGQQYNVSTLNISNVSITEAKDIAEKFIEQHG
jgi:hypothetical protein